MRVDVARQLEHRDVEHGREPLDLAEAPLLGEVPDPQLHRQARRVVDDDPAVAVEDRPALRLDADRAQLVVLRGRRGTASPRGSAPTRAGRTGSRRRSGRSTPRTPTLHRETRASDGTAPAPSGPAAGSGATGSAARRNSELALDTELDLLAFDRRLHEARSSDAAETAHGPGDEHVERDRRQQGRDERAVRRHVVRRACSRRPSPPNASRIVITATASGTACARSRPVVSP